MNANFDKNIKYASITANFKKVIPLSLPYYEKRIKS